MESEAGLPVDDRLTVTAVGRADVVDLGTFVIRRPTPRPAPSPFLNLNDKKQAVWREVDVVQATKQGRSFKVSTIVV
jgi:hypothetical protein